MTRHAVARGLSWTAVAFVLASLVTAVLLEERTRDTVAGLGSLAPTDVLYAVAVLATTFVGTLIVRQHPSHAVGWLLLLNGVLLGLTAVSDAYAGYAQSEPGSDAGERLAAVWYTHGWPPIFAAVVALAFVFPDGHLPSRRWRAVAVLGLASFTVTTLGGLLGPERLDPPFEGVQPIGLLPGAASTVAQSVGVLGMIVTLVLAMCALVVRFRRSDGQERLQMKWVALSGVFIPVAIVAGTVDGVFLSDGTGILTAVSSGLMLVAVPVAIGVAVLRYRLYDVDRVISATVLYFALTILLGAAFLAVVVSGGVALGRGSAIPTAAATVAVMLAFRPLRAWLQRHVDRLFNRSRYVALRSLEEFLDDLRHGRAEPESVREALGTAVGDPDLGVYFWFADQGVHLDASGVEIDPLPEEPPRRTPVLRGDELLATVLHSGGDAERTGLLADLLQRAGLAIEVARLRVEVRRQLTEVEASRARLVTAGQEERRRLERDLHDGAQQRLVAVGLDLRHLQQGMSPGPVRSGLDGAVAELQGAVRELRDLAHGVRPNALDDGLAPALSQLAARTAIHTQVDVTKERFPDAVEAAAYFVASEALTNAVKHSGASTVTVTAARENGHLHMVIADDGAGGAEPRRGSGLSGLTDRVEAVGGTFAVASSQASGTRLEAVFPCA